MAASTAFVFTPTAGPTGVRTRWNGPYSPARGSRLGIRVSSGQLGVHVDSDDGSAWWSFAQEPGVDLLVSTVKRNWGGGRVLLLPGGFVIKPENDVAEVGTRWLIGTCTGLPLLRTPDGRGLRWLSQLSAPAGKRYAGPSSMGLECVIQPDGSLRSRWTRPTAKGGLEFDESISAPSTELAQGFAVARPGEAVGRVRVHMDGSVTTNRQVRGEWHCLYVGQANASQIGARLWTLHQKTQREPQW